MGVIVNRRSSASVSATVPALLGFSGVDDSLFLGGPVRPSAVLVVAEFSDSDQAGILVTDRIGFISAEADVDQLTQFTDRARVFAGYAGWGAGQLEGEIEQADWLLARALEDDVFSEAPETLWGSVLERMGPRFALLARMPEDPSVN
jgi:putative transcriptional regulator